MTFNLGSVSLQALTRASGDKGLLFVYRTPIRVLTDSEVAARTALVFITDVACADVARQNEYFFGSAKITRLAPTHDLGLSLARSNEQAPLARFLRGAGIKYTGSQWTDVDDTSLLLP